MESTSFWLIARKVFRSGTEKSSTAIQKMRCNAAFYLVSLDFLVPFWVMQKGIEG
jgi:hypothetical protein